MRSPPLNADYITRTITELHELHEQTINSADKLIEVSKAPQIEKLRTVIHQVTKKIGDIERQINSLRGRCKKSGKKNRYINHSLQTLISAHQERLEGTLQIKLNFEELHFKFTQELKDLKQAKELEQAKEIRSQLFKELIDSKQQKEIDQTKKLKKGFIRELNDKSRGKEIRAQLFRGKEIRAQLFKELQDVKEITENNQIEELRYQLHDDLKQHHRAKRAKELLKRGQEHANCTPLEDKVAISQEFRKTILGQHPLPQPSIHSTVDDSELTVCIDQAFSQKLDQVVFDHHDSPERMELFRKAKKDTRDEAFINEFVTI